MVSNKKKRTVSYTIVESAEANPLEGRISNESPVGKALLDKKFGETIGVRPPAGMTTFVITNIE